MKYIKSTIILAIFLLTSQMAVSQLYPRVDMMTGYGYTLYNLEGYSQTGYVPALGRFMVEFGDYIEAGAELQMHILAPTFALEHPFTEKEAYREKFRSGYVGGVFRFYPFEDVLIDRILFGRIGLGWHFLNRKAIFYTDDYMNTEKYLDNEKETVRYSDPFGFNIGIGTNLGDDYRFTGALLYNFKRNTLAKDEDEYFGAGSFVLQLGFSMPLY